MNTYKITNITNLAGKRDFKFNSDLDIEFVDKMVKKTVKIKAGNSVYLTVDSLPMSVHKLRAKNLVSVTEISPKELEISMNETKSKTVQTKNEDDSKTTSSTELPIKKKITKKSHEGEPADN